VDVAKRLTFRIRGGMSMVGRLNTQKESVHEGEKKGSCNWGLLYKSKGLRQVCYAVHFPEQAVVRIPL
jgi:hypothetical protein